MQWKLNVPNATGRGLLQQIRLNTSQPNVVKTARILMFCAKKSVNLVYLNRSLCQPCFIENGQNIVAKEKARETSISGKGKLTQQKIMKIQNYYGSAIKDHAYYIPTLKKNICHPAPPFIF